MPGFFSPLEVCGASCNSCGLHRGCLTPKMPPTGEGRRRILVVAEAPGEQEDRDGVQLIGKSGQLLRKVLRKCGVDLDKDCWKTNAIICRPKANATPTDLQVQQCLPNLLKTIHNLKPSTIVLLGSTAVESLIGSMWKRDGVGSISRWVGWKIPCMSLNSWICPTYHPAYLLRANDAVLNLWFERHLQAAVQMDGEPWPEGPPDYKAQVEKVYEPGKAAAILRRMIEKGGTAAFDYETDRLKPESEGSQVVSCAVCWEGRKTIAYPWLGEAKVATSEFLLSGVKKLGWNIKFEQRWTKHEFGHGVRNWLYDGMVGTHVLDNRPEKITSAKFQAFVMLGVEPYDDEIRDYLKAPGGNIKNKIRQVDLDKLLTYNGVDAIVEYWMGVKQLEMIHEANNA